MLRAFLLSALLVTTMPAAEIPQPAPRGAGIVVSLWPKDRVPAPATQGPEKALPARGDNVLRLTAISEPSFTVYPAESAKPAPAVIICPGGGYTILAYDKEGTELAAWLNTLGITGVVLKYRVPANREGAFQDIQRAVRIVRHRAAEWNIAKDRVGVMGFSAGGHLSARLSVFAGPATYPRVDAADDQPLRPDFAILVYPAYLDQGMVPQVDAKTAPTFIAQAVDDRKFIAGTDAYFAALKAASPQHAFFRCATGGHGHGLRSDKEAKAWPEKCQAWLTQIGVLPVAR
ncbi:MAG: alpha/beta hydrolase [Verrucomicrobia bacterium]|nr:alpha/beta hydrolase [Verrucomicrobiota bacterium]